MYSKLVVGTDGSDTAKKAVREAGELAAATGAEVHVVTAYRPIGAARARQDRAQAPSDIQHQITEHEEVDEDLERAAEALGAQGVRVHTHAVEGDPAEVIIDLAEQQRADVIVVGNKGMTGGRRFLLGSVPDKIAHHAPCTVLIINTT